MTAALGGVIDLFQTVVRQTLIIFLGLKHRYLCKVGSSFPRSLAVLGLVPRLATPPIHHRKLKPEGRTVAVLSLLMALDDILA
jgi:hypothetical protein